MASPEIIGLMCAGSTNYHGTAGHGAGLLGRAELAALLAGVGGGVFDYAMAKYAGDVDSERKLLASVKVWAAGVAVRESWQVVRGRPTISNLCALAVFESVRPNRCGRCHGTGFKSSRLCVTCGGAGIKALSGRKIAEACGVDEAHFRRLWKPRYDAIYAYVNAFDGEVCRALRVADRVEYEIGC